MNKQKLLRKIKLIQKLIALYKSFLEIIKRKQAKGFKEFALAIRMRESSNNYQAVNSLGFLGAYQFGLARLCDLGYTKRIKGKTGYSNNVFEWKMGYSKEEFLIDNKLQDKIFKKHIEGLKQQILRFYGNDFEDKSYTLSGLCAGAHLGGIGGVKKFLGGKDNKDAYGTSVGDYVKKFSGYKI